MKRREPGPPLRHSAGETGRRRVNVCPDEDTRRLPIKMRQQIPIPEIRIDDQQLAMGAFEDRSKRCSALGNVIENPVVRTLSPKGGILTPYTLNRSEQAHEILR